LKLGRTSKNYEKIRQASKKYLAGQPPTKTNSASQSTVDRNATDSPLQQPRPTQKQFRTESDVEKGRNPWFHLNIGSINQLHIIQFKSVKFL